MKPTYVKVIEQALIVATVAVLSFAVQSSASLGEYGPIVGSVATILLTVLNKFAGNPVAKVAAKLSPRPF